MNIINVKSENLRNIPQFGNKAQYIAVHYLGVVGQNNRIESNGCGAHYYIYWDGTIYQAAEHNAVLWQVGTNGYYTQKHHYARNHNTIGIEMCVKCDGNANNATDPYWYFTKETQISCAWLVQKLMFDLDIPFENVLRHYDIVNKICPAPYVNNNGYKETWTWQEFKSRLSGSYSSQSGSYETEIHLEPYSDWNAVGTAICMGNQVNIRKSPNGTVIGHLNDGNRFEIDGNKNGEWVHVMVNEIGVGWIHKDRVKYD